MQHNVRMHHTCRKTQLQTHFVTPYHIPECYLHVIVCSLLQYTYDALLDRVQASESELQEGLERLDACCMDGTHSHATIPFTSTRGKFIAIGNRFLGAMLSPSNCGDIELFTALTLQSTVTFTTKRLSTV